MCDVEVKDSLAWVTAMKKMIENENNIENLKGAVSKIRTLAGKEVIEKELAEKLMRQLVTTITTRTLIKEGAPVTQLGDRVKEIASSILNNERREQNERENF